MQNFDPDRAQQKCLAQSGSKLFGTQMEFLTECLEKDDFEKKSAEDKKACKIFPVCEKLKHDQLILENI